jgi:hypothetical protein
MTTGAVIFAQNNDTVDYVKLAVFAASRIQNHLNIPVSIVTDSRGWLEKTYPNHGFDKIIDAEPSNKYFRKRFHDGSLASKTTEWKNLSRTTVYDLTPYDKTLVIDSDYIINSNILKSALDKDEDLQIYSKSLDLSGWREGKEFQRINEFSIPFYWATTFIFKKNNVTESFFALIKYIKENWDYYTALYNIESILYRNDYAFSIAIHIMNGNREGYFAQELPGTMIYTTDKDLLINIDDNKLKFLVEKQNHLGEYIAATTTGLDVHVMNKISLSRCLDE